MKTLFRPFRHFADFRGRASRPEFWAFAMFFVCVTLAGNWVDARGGRHVVFARMGLAELAATVALLLPMLAVGARRLHDTDRSGWWLLVLYLPYGAWLAAGSNPYLQSFALGGVVIGFVTLVVLWLLPGRAASNSYGLRPL